MSISSFAQSLLLAVACFSAQSAWAGADKPKLDPDAVAGCYDISLGAWEPALSLGADTAFVTPPTRVQLGTDRVPKPKRAKSTWRSLKPAPGYPASEHSYNNWLVRDTGGLVLSWSTGFSGLSMVLAVDGADLVGTAETFWDFPRPTQKASVRLTRVACDKPSA